MKKSFPIALFAAALIFFASRLISQDLGFKNLKVLKPSSKGELMRTMASYNKELGVKCDFCHNEKDYAIEANDKFTAARKMQTMVNEINEKYFNYKNAPQVSCVFCHGGNSKPKAATGKK